jgi:hypothetical protein
MLCKNAKLKSGVRRGNSPNDFFRCGLNHTECNEQCPDYIPFIPPFENHPRLPIASTPVPVFDSPQNVSVSSTPTVLSFALKDSENTPQPRYNATTTAVATASSATLLAIPAVTPIKQTKPQKDVKQIGTRQENCNCGGTKQYTAVSKSKGYGTIPAVKNEN